MDGPIRVLHVDDDPGFLEVTAAFLDRQDEEFEVTGVESASKGLELLGRESFHCVVGDYQMPGMDGIAFLEAVRTEFPDLPFVLFTGKGSEEVASDAIAAGVTDYLQKSSGGDQYALLANRLHNAVEHYQAQREVQATEQRFKRLLEDAADFIVVIGMDGTVEYVTPSVERILGYEPAALKGSSVFEIIHPEDEDVARAAMGDIADDPGTESTIQLRATTADGSSRWVEVKARNLVEDASVGGVVGNVRDITERKEQEATIDWHRTVLSNMEEGVYVLDSDCEFQFVNFRAENIGSLTESDWTGHHVSALAEAGIISPETAEEIAAAATEVFDGEQTEVRVELSPSLPADAETVELRLTPLSVPGREPLVLGTTRDVTDQRDHERRITALHDATRRFIGSDTPETVAELTVEAIHTILDIPVTTCYCYDATTETLVPTATTSEAVDLLDEPRPQGEGTLLWSVFQSGETRLFEDIETDPDREEAETPLGTELLIPLGEHGIIAIGATATDAFGETTRTLARTLAANAEAALTRVEQTNSLQESEARYQTLIENFPEGGVFRFDEDLRFTLAGGDGLQEVGLSPERMEGRTLQEILPEDIAAEQAPHYRAALNGEPRVTEQAYGGSYYRIHTIPLRNATGGIAVVQNVTERKEHEHELKRQNERLDQFASVLTHDLRNPLRVASGNLELAAQECNSEYLDATRSALSRIDDLIDQTLSLARSGHAIGDTEAVALDDSVRTWWESLPTDDATLSVANPPTVQADRDRLRQLFENLVRNALDHGGEAVTISVGATESGFYVADDGPGIPEAERTEVFEAGYTTGGDGTGLGLAIVEDIASAHGWTVTVIESDADGARFEVRDVETV